jgi:hypothetical protein
VSLLGSKAFFVLLERLQVQVNFKSSVRPAESHDVDAVRRVVAAAFGHHLREQVVAMVGALAASGHARASLVAEVEARFS